MNPKLITTPEQLVDHILYGDIDEMELSVLGKSNYMFGGEPLDDEQETRRQCAATVKAYFDGMLAAGGHLAETPKRKAKR